MRALPLACTYPFAALCFLATAACGDKDSKPIRQDAAQEALPSDDDPADARADEGEPDATESSADAGTASDAAVDATTSDATSAFDAASALDAQLRDASAPEDAAPSRVVIASGQHAPTGIAVNDSHVYFASRDDGTIVRCPRAGCGNNAPEVLLNGADHPIALALDASHLYWVTGYRNGETGAPTSRPVYRCPIADCSPANRDPVDRGTTQPYAIAVSDDKLYFASWPRLVRCPKLGCASSMEEIGSGPFVAVIVESDALYTAKVGQRVVTRCAPSGCNTMQTTVASDLYPMGIASDAEHLYMTDYNALNFTSSATDGGTLPARVLRCKKPECDAGVELLEQGDISPYAIASYGDRIYFTNVTQGTVISLRK